MRLHGWQRLLRRRRVVRLLVLLLLVQLLVGEAGGRCPVPQRVNLAHQLVAAVAGGRQARSVQLAQAQGVVLVGPCLVRLVDHPAAVEAPVQEGER